MRRGWGARCILRVVIAAGLAGSPLAAQDVERIVPARWQRAYDNSHYAPAVRVGNLLFLSGVTGAQRDGPNDIVSQGRRIFDLLGGVLAEAGADLSHVVSITTYHVDMPDTIRGFMTAKDEFLHEPYPTWTAVGVDRLYVEAALVEVSAIAVIPR